jgi:hypothetical protein
VVRLLNAKDTIIKKATGAPLAKIVDPATETLPNTATKLNELIQKLKDDGYLL